MLFTTRAWPWAGSAGPTTRSPLAMNLSSGSANRETPHSPRLWRERCPARPPRWADSADSMTRSLPTMKLLSGSANREAYHSPRLWRLVRYDDELAAYDQLIERYGSSDDPALADIVAKAQAGKEASLPDREPRALFNLGLVGRLRLVRQTYMRKALDEPHNLAQTVGSMIGEVVGRDALCNVIIEELNDPGIRRPHVVIGGVGAGKTALLVRLTKLLAERGVVPVPVRLRDAQESLDF